MSDVRRVRVVATYAGLLTLLFYLIKCSDCRVAQVSRTKYAAVMFHTQVSAFEAPLENIASLLSPEWSVKLFVPYYEQRDAEAQFLKYKMAVCRLPVVRMLASRRVDVFVLKHTVSHMLHERNSALERVRGVGFRVANEFALSEETYTSIPEERLLFFQEDSAFCVSSGRKLEQFMDEVWLGAPWDPKIQNISITLDNGSQVRVPYGNGGVSVRSNSFMLKCISDNRKEWYLAVNGDGVPEDIFFSKCFTRSGLPTREQKAAVFASEDMLYQDISSLAIHDPCRTADYDLPFVIGCASSEHRKSSKRLLQRCPEAKRVVRHCLEKCAYGNYDGLLSQTR